jgi:hypothetical protein
MMMVKLSQEVLTRHWIVGIQRMGLTLVNLFKEILFGLVQLLSLLEAIRLFLVVMIRQCNSGTQGGISIPSICIVT